MLPRSGRFIFRCLFDSKSMLSAWNRPPWESIELQLDPDPILTYWIKFKFAASQAVRPDMAVSPDLPNSPIAAQIIIPFFFPEETWSQFCGLARASAWICHNSQGTQAPVNAHYMLPCQEDHVSHTMISVSSFSVSARLEVIFADHVIYAIK